MARHNAASARKMVLAAEIQTAELALRIYEALSGMRRPPGKTAEQAMGDLDEDMQAGLIRAAWAAASYFKEVVNAGSSVS